MSSTDPRLSSGSRYSSGDDYNANKAKRKGFFNPRKSLSSSGPANNMSYNLASTGSSAFSSTTASPVNNSAAVGSNNGLAPNRRYPGNTLNGNYPSYSSYNSKYNSYYPSYGSYNTFKRDSQDSPSSTNDGFEYQKSYSRPSLNSRGSLSNSVPKRDRSRNNSLMSSKRSDTYYPSKSYFSKSQVDHYSTKKKYYGLYKQGYHDSGYSSYNKKPYSGAYPDSFNRSYSRSTDERPPEEPNTSEEPENVSATKPDDDNENDDDDMYQPTIDHNDMRINDSYTEQNESMIEKELDAEQDRDENDKEYANTSMEIDVPLPEKNLEPGKDLTVQENPIIETDLNVDEDDVLENKYPLNRLDTLFGNLKSEFESQNVTLKYAKVTSDIKEFPCYERNLRLYPYYKHELDNFLSAKFSKLRDYKHELWKEYKMLHDQWMRESAFIDEQLKVIHPPNDDMKKEIASADIRTKYQDSESTIPSTPVGAGTDTTDLDDTTVTGGFGNRRASRRHGDLVTTEAEFEEVLKNLRKQEDSDPISKALKVSATVPDLILEDNEKLMLNFMDSNNIVRDKSKWASRVRTEFFDNFTPEEHALFCEGFVKYPKKFGYISRFMGGLRTYNECVIHYYLTKKAVNYKNLIIQYKKKVTKKAPTKKRPKSRNASVNNPTETVATPEEEKEDSAVETLDKPAGVEIPPELAIPKPVRSASSTFGEELFTETGRRKRAAAPSFEQRNAKKPNNSAEQTDVAPTASPVQSNAQVIDIKKKSRKRKEENEPPLTPKDTPNIPKVEELEDTNGENKDKRKAISSYWSITEANAFPVLLKEHGTKWTTIADKLTTKTATMVRNYFQRNSEKFNWVELAQQADEVHQQKFGGVLSKPEGVPKEDPKYDPQSLPSVQTQFVPAPVYVTHPGPQPLPLPPKGLYQAPIVSFNRPTIGSLITKDPPEECHKPSIMNLLNSDSPVKTPESKEAETTVKIKPRRNNISALLNSPSNSGSESKFSDTPSVTTNMDPVATPNINNNPN